MLGYEDGTCLKESADKSKAVNDVLGGAGRPADGAIGHGWSTLLDSSGGVLGLLG